MRLSERQYAALQLAQDILTQPAAPTRTRTRTRRAAAVRPVDAPTGHDAIHFMGLSKLKPEQRLQIGFLRWVEATYPEIAPLVMASAGGMRTSLSQAVKMKSMGYRKGTPDIFVAVPKGGRHGLFLELKASGGKASPEQKMMIANLQTQGYAAAVVVGFEQVKATLTAYLSQT